MNVVRYPDFVKSSVVDSRTKRYKTACKQYVLVCSLEFIVKNPKMGDKIWVLRQSEYSTISVFLLCGRPIKSLIKQKSSARATDGMAINKSIQGMRGSIRVTLHALGGCQLTQTSTFYCSSEFYSFLRKPR